MSGQRAEGSVVSFIAKIAKVWNKYVEPLYNWIPAGVQALWWREHKRDALHTLETLERMAPNHVDLVNYFASSDWSWKSDPLGGALDFTSKLWVICARRGGDCDDFAALWRHLMGPHGEVETLVTGKKYSFHKMVIYTSNGVCYLFSNLRLFGVSPEEQKETLMNAFYGEDTWFSVTY